MLKRKQNFQCPGIKTTSPKNRRVPSSYKKKYYLKYDAYYLNFLVNSYKKWLKIAV